MYPFLQSSFLLLTQSGLLFCKIRQSHEVVFFSVEYQLKRSFVCQVKFTNIKGGFASDSRLLLTLTAVRLTFVLPPIHKWNSSVIGQSQSKEETGYKFLDPLESMKFEGKFQGLELTAKI